MQEPLPGKPPIKKFGLSQLRGGFDQFRGYSREEHDQINTRFKQIILDLGLVTLAAAVDRRAWNKLIVGPLKDEFGQPEEYCFVRCVDAVVATIRARKPGEQAYFFFDQALRPRFKDWAALYTLQVERYPGK